MGVGILKSSLSGLSQSEGFVKVLSALAHPAPALIFGILFTALLQSSSSSIIIFQAFAVEGLLDYRTCVFLIIGAALGSVTPNLLASLTTGRNGKRTALLNLYFNLLRAGLLIIIVLLFPAVLDGLQALSPGNIARQVANTHTIFAIFSVLVLLPFSGQLVKLAQKSLPLLPSEQKSQDERRLLYLGSMNAKTIPSVAIAQAFREINRLGKIARDNLETALRFFFDPSSPGGFAAVDETEATVDFLTEAIEDKLVELRSLQLSDEDLFVLSRLILVAADYERISDHAENVAEYTVKMQESGARISEIGTEELHRIADAVMESLDLGMQIFSERKLDMVPQAEILEQRVDDLQAQLMQNHIDRLMTIACDPLAGVVFTDMCTDLERCSDLALNVAQALVRK